MSMDKSEKKEAVCSDLFTETIFIIFAELAGFARPLRMHYDTGLYVEEVSKMTEIEVKEVERLTGANK